MNLKLSLAGDLGSGKSTVAKLLQERLGAEYYGTGVIAREMAASMGMDIAAFNIYMETHPEMDREFDRRLEQLSDDPRRLIVDSRMAWHFVRDTFRIYLTTDPEAAAVRVMRAGREAERFNTVSEAAERIRARKTSEKKRYFELYGVDCKDFNNYNIIIDTTFATPEQVADRIVEGIRAWESDRSYHAVFLCPRRLWYPDDAPDAALVAADAAALERGESLPDVCVQMLDDRFYVTAGVEIALAYSLCEIPLIPCRTEEGVPNTEAFVKMEDNL